MLSTIIMIILLEIIPFTTALCPFVIQKTHAITTQWPGSNRGKLIMVINRMATQLSNQYIRNATVHTHTTTPLSHSIYPY